MTERALLDTLPAPSRLALAYAPRAAWADWLALLAFDARLAGIVRMAREPLLAQVRLAWWRDRLGEDPARWPAGEPLLQALQGWREDLAALAPLVDGWEGLLIEPAAAPGGLIEARVDAFAALARRRGCAAAIPAVRAAARAWAGADLGEPAATGPARLPRPMRPLAVLRALARRGEPRAFDLLVGLRVGLFGR